MTLQDRWAGLRTDRQHEGGYVAVMAALLLFVLMGLSAFAVDVGNWYVVGQQEQRAADAAALAGVPSLPGDLDVAKANAKTLAKINGFEHLPSATTNPTTVTPVLDGGKPTRLRVTVSRTVKNIFGSLLGVPTTTVTRTAVADFGGPIPMGSPCNEFGNDPDPQSHVGAACTDVQSEMWANINSPNSEKANGDAYQSLECTSAFPADNCAYPNNNDYNSDGYFYLVSVTSSMPSLTIQLFDPVYVDVGLFCDNNLGSARNARNDIVKNSDPASVTDAATRYKSGSGSASDPRPYCTGDAKFGGTQVMNTQFTVRDPSLNVWNPTAFPVRTSCVPDSGTSVGGVTTYAGYSGPVFNVLNKGDAKYDANIVKGFRRWTTLCTITNPVVGDYLVQVKSNVGDPFDDADASNHFGIRAFGASLTENNSISIAGRERMSMYSNKPGTTNEFHLARVPTGAAGQVLRVSLFDVGDSDEDGNITILPPKDMTGYDMPDYFAECKGILSNASAVPLTDCKFDVSASTSRRPSDHNGKWQTVTVPIPSTYRCADSDPRACWVRLKYFYGGGSAPHDVTSWAASIDGDPVRLVE